MKAKKCLTHPLFPWPVIETKKAHIPAAKERDFFMNYVKPADIHVRRDIFESEIYKKPVKEGLVQNFLSKDAYVLENPSLKQMKASLQSCVDHYCYKVLRLNKKHQFYITQSWMNFNPKGTGHHAHFHPNSIISSVYFLQIPKEGAPITFYNPKNSSPFPQFEFDYEEWNDFNSISWWIPAVENSLLLFPSTLRHGVDKNKSKTPRVSMSFNVFAKVLGESENLNELRVNKIL